MNTDSAIVDNIQVDSMTESTEPPVTQPQRPESQNYNAKVVKARQYEF